MTLTAGGQPLVLLHGLGGDHTFWDREAHELADDFHVIAVDLRDGPTIADMADGVCAHLDSLGIASAHVVGFSMGGLVAQHLAAQKPDRVDKLVLASTYAVMNPQVRMFLDAVRDIVIAGGTQRDVYQLVCPWLFSIAFVSDPANAALLTAPDDDGESSAGWLAQYQAQRQFDGRSDLAAIAAPTLVLAGTEDRLVPPSDTTQLTEGLSDVTVAHYEGYGHLINIEAPERFVADLRNYLRDEY